MSAKRGQTKLSASAEWRTKGNEIYKSVDGLCPALSCQRLQRAIDMYRRAFDMADDDIERSSACKNIARASWKLAKSKTMLTEVNEKSVSFHFKEALKYFKDAQERGQERDAEWRNALRVNALECWDDIKQRLAYWENKEDRLSELQPVISLLFQDVTLAREQYNIAKIYLSWAPLTLAKCNFKKALGLLEKCSHPLSEAVRLGDADPNLLRDCHELEKDIYDRKGVAESVQARVNGDEILRTITVKDEDLLWEVVDWYHIALQQACERDLEVEATTLSALGRVYAKELNLQSQAEVYLKKAVELANTLDSSCLREEWYLSAKTTLQQYQKDQAQTDKLQKRALIMKELQGVLGEITDKFAKSSKKEFLKYLYSVHPPKTVKFVPVNDASLQGDRDMRKLYQKAVIHYHPDRVDEKVHGIKWKVLCEEITKLLSKQYDAYKTFFDRSRTNSGETSK